MEIIDGWYRAAFKTTINAQVSRENTKGVDNSNYLLDTNDQFWKIGVLEHLNNCAWVIILAKEGR